MFTRTNHFSRFATLAVVLIMGLTALLVAAFAPARTEAALCNRAAALLAHGFGYAPAGNATLALDPSGALVVANIGDSGQDGFCSQGNEL